MKLLGDIKMYCIKVDYFMWAEEKGQYTEPVYLSIDVAYGKMICFHEDIRADLRVFDTVAEAEAYIDSHDLRLSVCCENPEVVAIKYDFDAQKWKEIEA